MRGMRIWIFRTTDVDSKVLNHLQENLAMVFCCTVIAARCAIISLARLKAGYPGKPFTAELFLRRALTEAVHEVGHLLGIGHCPQPTCVMHFSNSLYDTDRKGPTFCSRCQEFLS